MKLITSHVLVAASLLALPLTSRALVKFNDGHDQIFVIGEVGVGYDSNIYGYSGGDGDMVYSAGLDVEYKRKAGMLSVDGLLGWDFLKYQDNESEDAANPHATLGVSKDSGRTTGSVKVGVKRDRRADSAINIRATSWDYDAELNVKYPVIERYSLAGRLGWDRRDFNDNSQLVDLTTWSASTDLLYTYNSQRDLFAGYRLRVTDTSADTRDTDHAITVGTTGRILPTINGTLRAGYQHRESERTTGERESFDGLNAAVSATWSILKRLNLTGRAGSDFNTIATDISVSTLSTGLEAQYAVNARVSVFAGTGVGRTRFLGARGNNRRDTYWNSNLGVAYTQSDRLKVSLTYGVFENWSTLAFSDYTRNTISLNLSSRW